jgi:hypothetical protein
MLRTIDLNSDMGESFGRWQLGNDAELMEVITSANIACGWHGGDPAVMRTTVELAVAKGVGIGAHVGLPDLLGFGRRRMQVTPDEIYDYTMYQSGALRAFAEAAGGRLQHVKPHGAFYTMSAADEALAAALVRAVEALGDDVVLYGMGEIGTGEAGGSRIRPRRLRRSELRRQRWPRHRAQQGRLGSRGGCATSGAVGHQRRGGDGRGEHAGAGGAVDLYPWRCAELGRGRATRAGTPGSGWGRDRAGRLATRNRLGDIDVERVRGGVGTMSAEVLSPLPGLVATIHVNAGDAISSGDPVVTLQSMKMEIPITAESDGTIAEILVSEGDEIDTGAVIARLS